MKDLWTDYKVFQCPSCKGFKNHNELEGHEAGEIRCSCGFTQQIDKKLWLKIFKKHQPELDLF